MSNVNLRWFDYDQRIFIIEFVGFWAFQDALIEVDTMLEMQQEHPDVCDSLSLIVDARNVARLPVGNVARYREVIARFKGTKPHIAVLGANPFVRVLVDAFGGLSKEHLLICNVDNTDEARTILKAWHDDHLS